MTVWQVQLEGDVRDLRFLAEVFATGPRKVLRDQKGPGYLYESDSFHACSTSLEVEPLDLLYPFDYNEAMFTVQQTEEFVAWLDSLKDKRAQVRIAARLRQAEAGSLGDWHTRRRRGFRDEGALQPRISAVLRAPWASSRRDAQRRV